MTAPAAAGSQQPGGSALDPSGELRAVVSDCVHCGFCLPACPTYQLWGEEMDSPRGRIHLIGQLLDGEQASAAAAVHVDRCLGCMACVPACPSGVRYDRLIEAARSWTEEPAAGPPALPSRSARDRALRAVIFQTFPYPRRLAALAGPLRAAQWAGLDALLLCSGRAARLPPELAAALRVAPSRPHRRPERPARRLPRLPGRKAQRDSAARLSSRGLPERIPALGSRRAVVGMLTGCVQQVFFPQVNAATARVLAAEGCDVIIPAQQGCCGALSLHGGRKLEAGRFARRAIETFEQAGLDAIVGNAAGWGSAMKEYGDLLAGDAGWAGRAAALSARVRDLSEFLAALGPRAPRHPLPVTVAYHDACHLPHAPGIIRQRRDPLRAIPGLTMIQIADGGTCC